MLLSYIISINKNEKNYYTKLDYSKLLYSIDLDIHADTFIYIYKYIYI